jgi:hypothetical protein
MPASQLMIFHHLRNAPEAYAGGAEMGGGPNTRPLPIQERYITELAILS